MHKFITTKTTTTTTTMWLNDEGVPEMGARMEDLVI